MKLFRILCVALAVAALSTACNKQDVTPESQLVGTSWKGAAAESDGGLLYELHLSFQNEGVCSLTALLTGSPWVMGFGGLLPSGMYGSGRYTLSPSKSGTYKMVINLVISFTNTISIQLEGDYTPGAIKLELTEPTKELFKKTSPIVFVLD